MTDLRIADAPELTAAEVNDSLKVPTGGYGNYSITMITIRDWLLNYKMFATQSYVDTSVGIVTTALNNHTDRVDNPHQVTKAQVGLGNVDNTSDINKPVSSATQTALTNLNTSLTSAISVKANAADVYTKSEVYTKVESDNKYHQKLSIDGILAPTAVFDDVKNIDGVNGTPDLVLNQPIQNLTNRTEFLKTHNNLVNRDAANAHPTSSILDESGQTQQEINELQKHTNLLRFPIFSVKAFGAKGDGVTDDRAAIQAAIDAAINAKAGTVYFDTVDNPDTGYYAIKSTNPDDPTCGLLFENSGSIYVGGNLSFVGNNYYSRVVLDTPTNISALLKFSNRSNYMVFDQAYFDANNKADHAFKADDEFHPYMTIYKSKFRQGLVSAASISTFVSDFYKTFFENSPVGISIHAPAITPSAPCTSITMNSCYAIQCTNRGYEFGLLTYSSLNACASDRTALGYYIGAAYGVSMNSCGCENVDKMLYVDSYRGFTINTMYGLTVGSLDSNNPTPYMIELASGMNATISGFYPVAGNRYFTYKLASTTSRYGSENITVTDSSIGRSEIYFVPTFNFARPIKLLRGDSTIVDRVYNCANSVELLSTISRVNVDFSIDHKITINLTGSSYDLGSSLSLLRVSGIGELIIQGSTSDRTVARVNCPTSGLNINQCSVKVRLKNLTLASTVSNGNARRVLADNSTNIVLDNVLLEQGAVSTGYAVISGNGSNVSLINGTEAIGTFGIKAFQANDTSKIGMEKRTSAPTTGVWTAGMSFEYINPTTHRGAFYNGTAWTDYV